MYIGIPAQIVELFPDQPERADVDCAGVRHSINLALLVGPSLAVGDWVLVNLGFAVATMKAADARASVALLEGLARSVDEEFVRDLAVNGT
jgi:hydrogenase expression/formation protein HypC